VRPYLVTVCLLVALVLSINGAAAWDRARHEARVRQLASEFRPGLALVFSGYVDERRLQKARIATIAPPRIVAFGSSRIRELSSATIEASAGMFYNSGMSAASVEDYIAMWALLRASGKIPEQAIFSLDAWLFNGAHEQVRWLALGDIVTGFLGHDDRGRAMAPVFSEAMYRWYRLKELLSFTVLTTSIADLERPLMGRRRLGERVAEALQRDLVPEAEVGGRNAIRADGSVIRAAGRPTIDDLRVTAERYARGGETHLGSFRWDTQRAHRLELLWRDMRAHGVQIVAYMAPYHPVAWRLLRSDPAQAKAIETTAAFLADLAVRLHVRFLDASDPGIIPCGEAEFYDAEHADPACLALVVTRLWRR
jgi:hypothetical protein